MSELVNIGMASPSRVHLGFDGIRNAIMRGRAATLLWMLIECSVALLAFGSDSLVEVLSASLVLMLFASRLRISRARQAALCAVPVLVVEGRRALKGKSCCCC